MEPKQSRARKEEAETRGGREETFGAIRNVLLMRFDFTKSHRHIHIQWINAIMRRLFLKTLLKK